MSEKDFVCNLCKIKGRRRDESNSSHYNFKQNLIIQRNYLFPISIAIILSGMIIIALSLSYFPFRPINNDNNKDNAGSSGFIYIFPLPFVIPIHSAANHMLFLL